MWPTWMLKETDSGEDDGLWKQNLCIPFVGTFNSNLSPYDAFKECTVLPSGDVTCIQSEQIWDDKLINLHHIITVWEAMQSLPNLSQQETTTHAFWHNIASSISKCKQCELKEPCSSSSTTWKWIFKHRGNQKFELYKLKSHQSRNLLGWCFSLKIHEKPTIKIV